jgi:hypothetical protein
MMNTQSSKPFAEVIQSAIHTFIAQTWQWNEFPAFGSLVCAQVQSRTIFALVHDIKTGSIDSGRSPFTYQKMPEDLEREQPQIFALLQTAFTCQVVGYNEQKKAFYLLAPEPLPIHTFIAGASREACEQFFSSFAYLHILFASTGQVQNLDELLLAVMQRHQPIFHNRTMLFEFMKVFSLLTGNDYRRIKLFLQRVEAFMPEI